MSRSYKKKTRGCGGGQQCLHCLQTLLARGHHKEVVAAIDSGTKVPESIKAASPGSGTTRWKATKEEILRRQRGS